ncbi:MAG: ATP-binding protein [Anaerolineales bacterium]|nr:ATP-binding protein [Anaerolineales bacterium]
MSDGNTPVTKPVHTGRVVAPAGAGDDLSQRLTLFNVEAPRRRLADLIVPEPVLAQLRALLTKIKYHRVLYEDFGLSTVDPAGGRTAINLYGPPGTGKSFAAEALAAELGLGLLRANYAEIESKFVGETAKNIQAAFAKARQAQAVLFFDEADSILGRRLTAITQSTDHAVNVSRSVMLLELDHFAGVTIFATNLASNYDPAFVRRILGHVALPLPGPELRARLWRAHIPAQLPAALAEGDWQTLVDATDGLAGGDILNSVITAAAAALEREGPGCTVRLSDFLAAVEAAKRAKREVGARLE